MEVVGFQNFILKLWQNGCSLRKTLGSQWQCFNCQWHNAQCTCDIHVFICLQDCANFFRQSAEWRFWLMSWPRFGVHYKVSGLCISRTVWPGITTLHMDIRTGPVCSHTSRHQLLPVGIYHSLREKKRPKMLSPMAFGPNFGGAALCLGQPIGGLLVQFERCRVSPNPTKWWAFVQLQCRFLNYKITSAYSAFFCQVVIKIPEKNSWQRHIRRPS